MEERIQIFVSNLKHYMELKQKNQKEVANAIGVLPATFNTWMQGKAIPRMGKMQLLANYFNVNISDLIEPRKKTTEDYSLSEDEKALIEVYRNEDPTYRKMMDLIIFNYIENQKDGK